MSLAERVQFYLVTDRQDRELLRRTFPDGRVNPENPFRRPRLSWMQVIYEAEKNPERKAMWKDYWDLERSERARAAIEYDAAVRLAQEIPHRVPDYRAMARNALLEIYAGLWEAAGVPFILGGMRFSGEPIRQMKGRTHRLEHRLES